MSYMSSIPLKSADKLDWVSPLKKHIKSTYTKKDVEAFAKDIQEIQNLRDGVKAIETAAESGIDPLFRYFHVLVAIDKKFAFSEGSSRVKMNFNWHDPFRKRRFGESSSGFEEASVLYNVAAIYSQVGARQNLTTPDGVKAASSNYQLAAGVLSHIKEHIQLRGISPELADDFLDAVSSMMLAQAQECIYNKAAGDKMKDGILSKLAKQASDYYNHASESFNNSASMKENGITALYANNCKCKAAVLLSCCYYHEGMNATATEQYGASVGWLRRANASIAEAIKLSKPLPEVLAKAKEVAARIAAALESAEKDNAKIYMMSVPSDATLPQIEGKALAKPAAFPDLVAKFGSVELFASLLPPEALEAAEKYNERKAALVRATIASLDEQTTICRTQLASMGLPASVEAVLGSAEGGLPASLRTKMQQLDTQGGVSYLVDLFSTLEELRSSDAEILVQCNHKLDGEEKEDRSMREHYGAQWRRTPSTTLTVTLRKEVENYNNTLRKATDADAIVKNKFNTNKDGIAKLQAGEDAIMSKLRGTSAASQEAKVSTAVLNLRQVLTEIDSVIASRETVKDQLKQMSETDDAAPRLAILMTGMNGEQAIDRELGKYNELKSKVDASISQQTSLCEKTRMLNDDFNRSRSGSDRSVTERQQVFQQLEVSYNAFEELRSNLTEGIHFYSQFQETLNNLARKVDDFVFARNTEKSDLVRNITESFGRMNVNEPQGGTPQYQYSQPSYPYSQQQQAPSAYGAAAPSAPPQNHPYQYQQPPRR